MQARSYGSVEDHYNGYNDVSDGDGGQCLTPALTKEGAFRG